MMFNRSIVLLLCFLGNGIISAPDLRLIMTTMGEKLTEEQVEEMIQFADSEAQGEINYKGKHNFASSLS